ncbi:MAG: hypothetical protein JWL62_1334 [Hyphomicrobiales bacterium]|nr:hypothetical protein [Hyphomicrobiales bacterium]
MTDRIEGPEVAESDPEIARLIWQMAGIGFGFMAMAAALLWWHYGPLIFFDSLAALQSCF